jgi:hypothetical protein
MLAVGAFLLFTLAAACGGDDKTIDLPGDGDLTVSEDDPPEGFPDDFPVYDGADFVVGGRQTVEGAEALSATWETDDSADDVTAFYEEKLAKGDWSTIGKTDLGDSTSILFERSGADEAGQVTIVDDSGKTTIVVTIGEGFGAGSGDDSGDDAEATPDDSGSGTSSEDLPDEVDVPAEFPSDRVPLPDGARVTQAATTTVSGATSHLLQFYSKDSVEDVADYFKSELEGNGFTQSITSSQDGGVFAIYTENEDGTGLSVTVTITNSEVPGYSSALLHVIEQ